jgi:hypothetical protein
LYEIKTWRRGCQGGEPSAKKHNDQMQLGMLVHGAARCVYVTYMTETDKVTDDAVIKPASLKMQIVLPDSAWRSTFIRNAEKYVYLLAAHARAPLSAHSLTPTRARCIYAGSTRATWRGSIRIPSTSLRPRQ